MSEQDNKNELNHPLTKGEFQEHLETLVKVVTTKEDMREMGEVIKTEIMESNDKVLASNDKIVKKLDTILVELPVISDKQRNHNDRIENLETKTRHIQVRLGI